MGAACSTGRGGIISIWPDAGGGTGAPGGGGAGGAGGGIMPSPGWPGIVEGGTVEGGMASPGIGASGIAGPPGIGLEEGGGVAGSPGGGICMSCAWAVTARAEALRQVNKLARRIMASS